MKRIKVFEYLPDLDAFRATQEFVKLSDTLGLSEWNHVVWIGRLFIMDNDLGEHWFDNWELRESVEKKAASLGIDSNDLLMIDPARFTDGRDGPCNTPETRKLFWTDVLCSLELSYELLFLKARQFNDWSKENLIEDYLEDLEDRIARFQSEI